MGTSSTFLHELLERIQENIITVLAKMKTGQVVKAMLVLSYVSPLCPKNHCLFQTQHKIWNCLFKGKVLHHAVWRKSSPQRFRAEQSRLVPKHPSFGALTGNQAGRTTECCQTLRSCYKHTVLITKWWSFACLIKGKLNILSETFIKQLPNGDKQKTSEHPVTDVHLLQKEKMQNVTFLFISEECNFTIILEKILQRETKTDTTNAKSTEFKKWDFCIAPLAPQIFFK